MEASVALCGSPHVMLACFKMRSTSQKQCGCFARKTWTSGWDWLAGLQPLHNMKTYNAFSNPERNHPSNVGTVHLVLCQIKQILIDHLLFFISCVLY